MSAQREAPRTRSRDLPAVDDEREVDVGRYLDALLARWWLPVLGLLAGAALGYLLSLSSADVYRAQATVYVGAPYAPGGNSALLNFPTANQNAVARIVKSEDAIEEVSRTSGMPRRKLRAGIATQQLRSGLGRLVPSQLYVISVKGDKAGETQVAARALADRVEQRTGGYARNKISSFQQRLRSLNTQLEAVDLQVRETQQVLARSGLSPVERLVAVNGLQFAEQRRGTLEEERTETRQLLALAEEVEAPRVLDRAVAVKTTARSTRNTVAVAAFLGLLLAIFAALLWEPVTSRTRD